MIDEDTCTRSKLEVTAREENVLKRRDVCGVVVPSVNGYVQAPSLQPANLGGIMMVQRRV